MADRLLLGQRGSQYGLYVSRPTANVLSCSDDELIFSTDSNDQVDHAIVLQEISNINQSAGSTVNTATTVTTATGETSFALVEGADALTTSFVSGSTFSSTLGTSYSGSGYYSPTVAVADQDIKILLFKGIPSTSLF